MFRKKEKISDLYVLYDKLQRQIVCGVEGHKLELQWVLVGVDRGLGLQGYFKCRHCNVESARQLKFTDVGAAEQLGFITTEQAECARNKT